MIIGKLLVTFLMLILFILFIIFSICDDAKKEDKTIRIILNFGIFLVLTSSVIFTTSSWESLSVGFKEIFLVVQTLLFFIFGIVLRYLFKIKKTGDSLIFVGSILFNITYVFILYSSFANNYFILRKFIYLYLALLLVLDALLSSLIMIVNKSKNYLYILLSTILIPFFISMFLCENILFSLIMVSVFLLILNIFKKLFKNKNIFDTVNLIGCLLSFILLLFSLLSYLIKPSTLFLGRISILILFVSVVANMTLYLKNKDIGTNIMILIYDLFSVILVSSISNSITFSLLVIAISSILFFALYYFSKQKTIYIPAVVISYLLALSSMIVACFMKDYIILAPFISLIFLLMNYFNSFNEKSLKALDNTFRVLFVIMFVISIVIQPMILKYLNISIVMIIITYLFLILYIVSSITKKSSKTVYEVLLLISLFIAPLAAENIVYLVIMLLSHVISYTYMMINKGEGNKIVKFLVFASFMMYLLTYQHKIYYHLVALVICVLLKILNKEKEGDVYLLCSYIPMWFLISFIPDFSGMDHNYIKPILSVFLVMFPVEVFIRRLIKIPNFLINLTETILLTLMFIPFIFELNIYVALTLGIISALIFILGFIFKQENLIYIGFIFSVLIILIQTFYLWKELPWWVYILVLGIILIVVAFIKEINKNNKDS